MAQEQKQVFDMESWMKDEGYTLTGVDPKGTPIAKDQEGNVGPLDVDSILKDQGIANRDDIAGLKFNSPSAPLESSPMGLDRMRLDKLFSDENTTKEYLKKNFDDFRINEDDGTILGEKNGVWSKLNPSVWGNGDAWKFTKALVKFGLEGPSYSKNEEGQLVQDDPRFRNLTDVKDEFMKGVRGLDKSTDKSIGEFSKELISGAPQTLKNFTEAAAASTMANATLWATKSPAKALAAGGAAAGVVGTGIKGVTTSLGRIMGTYNAPIETQVADSLSDGVLAAFGHTVGLGVQPQINHFWNLTKTLGKYASDDAKALISKVWAAGAKEDPMVTRQYFAPSFIKESAKVMSQAKSTAFEDVQRVTIPHKAGVINEILTQGPKQIQQNYADDMTSLFTDPKAKDLGFTHEDLALGLHKVLGSLKIGNIGMQKVNGVPQKYVLVPHMDNAAGIAANGGAPIQPAMQKELLPYVEQLIDHLNAYKFKGQVKGEAAARILTNFQKGLNFVSGETIDEKLASQLSRFESQISAGMKNQTAQVFDKVGLSEKYLAANARYAEGSNAMRWANYTLPKDNKAQTVAKQFLTPGYDDTDAHLNTLAGSLGGYGAELIDRLKSIHAVERSSRMMSGNKWYGFGGPTAAIGLTATGHPVLGAMALVGGVETSPKAQAVQAITAQRIGSLLKGLDKATMTRVVQDPKLLSTILSPVFGSETLQSDFKNQLLQKADQSLNGGLKNERQ